VFPEWSPLYPTPAVWVFWLRDPWTRHKPKGDSGNQKTDRQTFGCNATLLMPGAAENAKVLLEEQVPVINFALGKGDWLSRMP